jgi:ATP-dependent RNA helicase RhlE
MPFSSLQLSAPLLKALADLNYKEPYPIQTKAIPAILDKKDLLGIAKTGSGKTASFVLPTLMNLAKLPLATNRHIRALVLVPTRELAIQVEAVFQQFGEYVDFPFKSMAVYGGASINPQMMGMNKVNVLVATPGRLIELKESNALHFEELTMLILDEADKMLNLGFKEEMDKILSFLPKKRQNLLFSATLSEDIDAIQSIILKDPVVIKIASQEQNINLIQQTGYWVKEEKKGPLLRHLILSREMKQVLIFASSTYQCDLVTDKLNKHGIKARAIHSKKSQGGRNAAITEFKNGSLRVLVATDLLSRGIDIVNLPFVINYELPRSPKDFVHRIGRTGRAENNGEAITLVTQEDAHHFKVIQKKMKHQVDMVESENLDF